MTLQFLNQELIDLILVHAQGRNEANFSLAQISSMLSGVPGVRGAWIASSFDQNGNMYDFSEQNRVLTYNGNPTYNYSGLAPYIDLDGTGDYLSRADEAGLDITGIETYVASDKRGLSLGGWFYFDVVGNPTYLMSKWLAAANLSYELYVSGGNAIFQISSTGAAGGVVSVTSSVTLAVDTWYYIVGSFDPSTSLNIYVNKTKDTNVAAIPASVFSGTANFRIGATSGLATNMLNGRFSHGFLSTMFLSDSIINNFYQQSRSLFGV